jgi:hypothetical protein
MPEDGFQVGNLPSLNSFSVPCEVYLDEAGSSGSTLQPLMATPVRSSLPIPIFENLEIAEPSGELGAGEFGLGPDQDEFTWLFQEQGLFGLPENNYFSLPGDQYLSKTPNFDLQDNTRGPLNTVQAVSAR